MRLSLALLLPYITLVLATQDPVTLQVHHRYLSPHESSHSEWMPLGIIPVDEDMTASTLDTAHMSPGAAHAAGSGGEGSGDGWYQVGVEQDGLWVIGSTRACLLSPSPPSLTLHLQTTHLTSLSITPHLSRCDNSTARSSSTSPSLQSLKDGSRKWDIQINRARRIDSPSLPAPPSLVTADPSTGLPKPPEPEKTLLQKYWLPLLGISLFLLGQLGSGTAQATQGESGGGASGQGGT